MQGVAKRLKPTGNCVYPPSVTSRSSEFYLTRLSVFFIWFIQEKLMALADWFSSLPPGDNPIPVNKYYYYYYYYYY